MVTAILWPDAEAELCDFLRPNIHSTALPFAADVHVSSALPNPRPTYAVQVRNDGGPPTETVFADLRFGVNVWAPTRDEALDLAAYVTALINGMAETHATPFVDSSATVASLVPQEATQVNAYLTATVQLRGIQL